MMDKIKNSGFSLLEMTVVVLILGLLIGGMLMPLQAQWEYSKRQRTTKALAEIKEALIGFAILNGRFPCPSFITDPAHIEFGVEAISCASGSATRDGFLPWKSLGVSETDAWGITQRTDAGSMQGYWRYRIDENYVGIFSFTTQFSDQLQIRNSVDHILTTTTERPIAVIYSTGKNLHADGENADYEASAGVYQSDAQSTNFDDILIWITRPLLMNRMVSAGKLP
jgi:prepilin-type N-terminal cleavage/methylation domain-containing protein